MQETTFLKMKIITTSKHTKLIITICIDYGLNHKQVHENIKIS